MSTVNDYINALERILTNDAAFTAIIKGPASGPASIVVVDGVPIKTVARVISEVPSAEADRVAADAAAALASAQAATAAVSATVAQTARTGAESARDAALIQAGVYVDEPTGRTAVADGQTFKVQGSGDVAAYEYRRVNAGASTLIGTYPSKGYIDGIVSGTKTSVLSRTSDNSAFSTRLGYATFLDAGVDLVVGDVISELSLAGVQVGAGGATLRIDVWKRLQSAGSAAPGSATGDVVIANFTSSLAALGIGAGDGTFHAVTAPVSVPFKVDQGYSYGVEIYALDAASARVVVGSKTMNGALSPDRRTILYKASDGTWGVATNGTITLGAKKFVSVLAGYAEFKNAESRLVSAEGQAATNAAAIAGQGAFQSSLSNSLSIVDRAISDRAYVSTDFSYTSGFYQFSFGVDAGSDLVVGRPFQRIGIRLQVQAAAVNVRVQAYSRLLTSPNIQSAPGQVDDVDLGASVIAVSGLGLTALTYAEVVLPLAQQIVPGAGKAYIFTIEVLDGSGVRTAFGMGRADPTGLSQHQRGYFRQGSATAAWSATGSTAALRTSVHADVYTDSDLAARTAALEAKQAAISALARKAKGRIGIGGHAGRMEFVFDNSTPKTFRKIFTLPQHIDAVQIIFAHASANTMHVMKAAVAPLDSAANFALAGVTWTAATFGGLDYGSAPVRPALVRRAFLVSDWIQVSSLPRADDATKLPLLAVSAYIDTPALILQGRNDGYPDMTAWASHPVRPCVMRYNDGDCVTTPANFTSTTNRSTCPIVGLRYLARGQVVSVFASGDSITNAEGSGVTYPGASAVFEACRELSTLGGVGYDFFNLGWSGCQTDKIRDHAMDAINAGLVPDIMIYAPFSPNDITAASITDAQIAAMWPRQAQAVVAMEGSGVETVLWTGMPSNSSIKPYGTSDSKRRAYNDAIRAMAARGVVIADIDAVMAGADSGGQTQMVVAYTTDGIHPNDAGIQATKPIMKNSILACNIAKTGALITS